MNKNKKKPMLAVLMLFIACCILPNAHAFADEGNEAVYHCVLQIGNNSYTSSFWGQVEVLQLDPVDANIMPILYEGNTMLPLRAFSKLLNFDGPMFYDVEWDDGEKKASLCLWDSSDPSYYRTVAEFRIGSADAVFYDENGENPKVITLPAAPVIVNSRTYLPLRAIMEATDFGIHWVSSKKGIVVYAYGDLPRNVTFPDGFTLNLR